MKIEKLTDNKIRIIIDIDELSDKNIDINSLIKNTDKSGFKHFLISKIFKSIENALFFCQIFRKSLA